MMLIELDLRSLLLELRPPALGFQNFPLQRSWPRRFSAPLFFALRDFSHALPFSSALDRVEQSFPRELAIYCLRPRILDGDADAGREMPQRHCGGNFVDVLTARPGGPGKRFFEIGVINPELLHSLGYVDLSHNGGIFSRTQANFHANADR